MTDAIQNTLAERGSNYGPFQGHAYVSQQIKTVVRAALSQNPRFASLDPYTRSVILEQVDMDAHKLGRIVNGDPLYLDSWQDRIGYATLVVQHIESITVQKQTGEQQ